MRIRTALGLSLHQWQRSLTTVRQFTRQWLATQ
jgi:hypothetical protein